MFIPTTQAPGTNSANLVAHLFFKEELPFIWEELEDFLRRSAETTNGSTTVKYLQDVLLAGEAIVFAALRDNKIIGVVVARFVEYPGYVAARILACAGSEAQKCRELLEEPLESWALKGGAVEIEGLCCNPAMVRFVRRFGYKPRVTTVTKDLRRRLQ